MQLNLESQRRQYELVDVARRWGFRKVDVIDEDLGRTASGAVERPGFERLVDDLCTGHVGAVLCLEASRLSRNGPDWHRLLELCGEVDARVIDLDGVYDPGLPNDRLLLGMKGSISEFELGVLRARMHATVVAELRRYLAVRARHGALTEDSPLFLSPAGGFIAKRRINKVFQKLRTNLGWTARGGHGAVRIHDLRHTLICRRIQLWHEHGADIDNAMAALSTYVGHAKISDTYWYLTGVPELMAVAGKRFELFASTVGRDHHD